MTDSTPPMERLEQALVEDRRAGDVAELVLSGLDIPIIAPILTTWLGQKGQRERLARIRDVLVHIDKRVARLEEAGERVMCDEEWAELVTETLQRVARERSSEKRELFANLLANGARTSNEARREEARTMSRLLDEIEYTQAQLLHATVIYSERGVPRGLPVTASDVRYGPSSPQEIDDATEAKIEMDIARLTTLGLARNEIPGIQPGGDGRHASLDLVPTQLGRALHSWIMMPSVSEEEGAGEATRDE